MTPSSWSPNGEAKKHKMVVKNVLRNQYTGYEPFPPTARYAPLRAPRQLPFSLSSPSDSSKRPSLAARLASFRYVDDEKPVASSGDEQSANDSDSLASPSRQLPQRKSRPVSFDFKNIGDEDDDAAFVNDNGIISEEEDSDEDDTRATQSMARKRKRRRQIMDSDQDDSGDEDEAYVDEQEKGERIEEKMASSITEKASILRSIFPRMSMERIENALQQAGGSHVLASKILSGFPTTLGAKPTALRSNGVLSSQPTVTRKKLRRNIPADSTDEESTDESDDDKPVAPRITMEEARKMAQTVRFYNQATSQEIQDVTGCKPEHAEKLIELRPFANVDDLREKLQQQRGLSVKYISAFVDMMDGYSVVDQIIEEIEQLGSELKRILDIWNGETQDTSRNADSAMEIDGPDESAGMHLTSLQTNTKVDKTSAVYKDAMDGYLTRQPKIVDAEFTLKDYQVLGVNWLLMLYRKGISGILADEMGLGKTAQVISFLGRLYEMGEHGPHLIIVPTSTMENWLREFERFCPTLTVHGYHGTQDERFDLREDLLDNKESFQVLVTTYNIATGNKEDRSFLRKLKCKSMILDEGHMVRNCTSARYRHLISLKTPFRLLLTGTPLQNNLQELVSLLMFIMPNMLEDYEEEIRKIFKIKAITTSTAGKEGGNASSAAQLLSQQRIARAKKMMTPFVLRRRKVDVLKDLPQKIQVIEKCSMTKAQQKLYDGIVRDSRQSYEQALDAQAVNPKKTKKENGFDKFKNIIIQLRKAADHPLLFRNIYTDAKLRKMAKDIMKEEEYWDANEEYIYEDMSVMSDFELNRLCKAHKAISKYKLSNNEWMDAGKVEKLQQILPVMKQKGNKVLIFSQFTRLLDILELVMDTMGISFLRLDGETKLADRQTLIDQFNEDKAIDVFLLSTKAGGFGINLTSANVVILYDLDFNPQTDKQAEDRAHRVGQTRDVTVIKMITQNSIEEHILRLTEIKLRLDRSVSGLAEEEQETEEDKKNIQSLLRTVLLSETPSTS